jgi:hypothetical protein
MQTFEHFVILSMVSTTRSTNKVSGKGGEFQTFLKKVSSLFWRNHWRPKSEFTMVKLERLAVESAWKSRRWGGYKEGHY